MAGINNDIPAMVLTPLSIGSAGFSYIKPVSRLIISTLLS